MKLSELRKEFDAICEKFKSNNRQFFFVNENKSTQAKASFFLIPHLLPARTVQDTFCDEEQSGIYQVLVRTKREQLDAHVMDDLVDSLMDEFRSNKYVEVPFRSPAMVEQDLYYSVAVSIPYRF